MLALSIATLLGRRAPAGFSPSELFANSEVGVWYDPSDFSTLYQDTSGTTPVTAVEQPVGKMLDKSGNGFHATAVNNSTARPVLKSTGGLYYLAFDGVDDGMSTASIDFSATDEMSVFAGVTKINDSVYGNIAELSATVNTNNGSFAISSPGSSGVAGTYGFRHRGTQTSGLRAEGYAPPNKSVLSVNFDIGGADRTTEIFPRVNGVTPAVLTNTENANAGTGNFGNYPVYIGIRGGSSNPFGGSLYSLIVRGKTSTAQEIDDTEAWVANKTGVTL